MKRLANRVGARWLRFKTPKVVAPPGRVEANGRRNVIVATPMRSGTHMVLDALLNNLPAYRRSPLYVDLDRLLDRSRRAKLNGPVLEPGAGYLIKSHFPVGVIHSEMHADQVRALAQDAFVITVERNPDDIRASLERWSQTQGGSKALQRRVDGLDENLDAFWALWRDAADIGLSFPEIFDADRMEEVVRQTARALGVEASARFRPTQSRGRLGRLYLHKALTRLLGRHAPRINTTIHVAPPP